MNNEREVFKVMLKETVKDVLDRMVLDGVISITDEEKYEEILNNLKNKTIK
jgi:hypothetical protein